MMDWRVDFSIEPDNYFNIQFRQDNKVVSVLLDYSQNTSLLTDIARAVIAVWYGGHETHILWYDYSHRYDVFYEVMFTGDGEDVVFEIAKTDTSGDVPSDITLIQIRDTRQAICHMFWKGMRRFQGANLTEQYNAVFETPFPEEEVSKLTQLMKPPKR